MTAPLVRAEIDLRDFPYMPLDVVRLRDSDLSALSSGEGFRAAVMLWCACWHQIPAASLPDDDRILASLAGFGRAVGEWVKLKDEALRGFVICDDGRFYHPLIAEKANDAWEAKMRQRARTEAARRAKLGQKASASCDSAQDVSVTELVTDDGDALLQAPRERDRERDIGREETDICPLPETRQQDHSENSGSEPDAEKPAKRRIEYPDAFEQFWTAYPTDPLMAKKTAFDRWRRLDEGDRAKALAAIPAFRAYCSAHPNYRPVHACKFISDRRFDGFAAVAVQVQSVAGFYAKAETKQREAWDVYFREKTGKSLPSDARGGWMVPTEWPPSHSERVA
jgi:hypothetical protein